MPHGGRDIYNAQGFNKIPCVGNQDNSRGTIYCFRFSKKSK